MATTVSDRNVYLLRVTKDPAFAPKPFLDLPNVVDTMVWRRRWDSNPRARLITGQPDFESGPVRPLRYSSAAH